MKTPRPPIIVAGCIVFNGLLLAGLAWSARRLWRRRRVLPRETPPFVLIAVIAVGIHVLPSAQPRMLLPIVPVLLWFVAQAARPSGETLVGPARVAPPTLGRRGS